MGSAGLQRDPAAELVGTAGWYLRIAADGYPDNVLPEPGQIGNRWAFYPGQPGLTRAVAEVSGFSLEISAILVATLAGLLAAVSIWILVEEHLGRDAALTATALVCFFPSAYVLSMGYSESLFLLGAAVCLRTIGRRQWVATGLTASATCLVRATGVALVAAIVVAAGLVMYRERLWRPLVGVVLAPLGLIGWAVVQWASVGTPTAYFDAQRLWWQGFVWFRSPFESLWHVLTDRATWSDAPDVMAAGALVFVAVSAVLAVQYATDTREPCRSNGGSIRQGRFSSRSPPTGRRASSATSSWRSRCTQSRVGTDATLADGLRDRVFRGRDEHPRVRCDARRYDLADRAVRSMSRGELLGRGSGDTRTGPSGDPPIGE